MNDILITARTPIEVALGVDENGMTTARNLYDFLEMDLRNYSRWCKNNISDNQFAEENIDYWVFFPCDENPLGGRPTQDYKITSKFARKLSMLQKNNRGEQARDYFSALEDRVKQKVIDRTLLSAEMQFTLSLAENMAKHELEQKKQAEKIEKLENNQKAIADTFVKESQQDFRSWVKQCITAIAESPHYPYIGNATGKYREVTSESYKRLNQKKPCRLNQRVETEKGRAAISGATTSQVNAINKLTIIEGDKALRPIYETVLKEMMIAYCIQ